MLMHEIRTKSLRYISLPSQVGHCMRATPRWDPIFFLSALDDIVVDKDVELTAREGEVDEIASQEVIEDETVKNEQGKLGGALEFALSDGGPAYLPALDRRPSPLPWLNWHPCAQYRWSATFVPKWNRFFDLIQGISNVALGLIIFNYPDYVPQRWHTTLIMWGFTIFPFLGNLWLQRIFKPIEAIGAICHIVFFTVNIVTLTMSADKSTMGFVFHTLADDVSGWMSPAIAWGLGLLTITYPPTGLLPGNCSKSTTSLFVSMLAIILFFSFFNVFASVSRLAWASSQHNGLPFSTFFVKVHLRFRQPINALMLIGACLCLLALINVRSSVAFNVFMSLPALALHISYFLPIFFLFCRRLPGETQLLSHGVHSGSVLGRRSPTSPRCATSYTLLSGYHSQRFSRLLG
ncbi:hypothetical protein CC78DRAFT_538826 [Lojkania enalia]|uniref:Uncharacterized protein n=1 Tax=Lojkania enalia TaxID=147567 RepID=A0A9P4NDP5_9PLEO|nr:hypothetical protein CC78DRAFT_538826 [Didymosphaeria enalia]